MRERASVKRLRCAIYTRKSTEEGLEQDFNSLQAQREACEAYIKSQKHEGWTALPAAYDDGGFSGGTMERPALQKLISDIRSSAIDIVVVYKVDRLTRSLMDFAKIVDVFDSHGVSFVSVTQSFNTTTSMGRLTLNVLLSFAQFEREVTGERIRDKIAASKKKGLWMGGPVPLGYAVKDRKLIVLEEEAQIARHIFARYLALGSVMALKADLDASGVHTPRRRFSNGRITGGIPYSRGQLYALLKNPILIGRVHHKAETYPGEHAAVIEQSLWDEVQALLETNSAYHGRREGARHPSLLTGALFGVTGARLTPIHANKGGKRYRYYVSSDLAQGTDTPSSGWRLPAQELENAVISALCALLTDRHRLIERLDVRDAHPEELKALFTKARELAEVLRAPGNTQRREVLHILARKIVIDDGRISIEIGTCGLLPLEAAINEAVVLDIPAQFCRRGVERKVVIPPDRENPRAPDPILVQTIARAFCWFERLCNEPGLSIRALAKAEQVDLSTVSRILPLAFLAPGIVDAILHGRQPVTLTAKALVRRVDLPIEWKQQVNALTCVDEAERCPRIF